MFLRHLYDERLAQASYLLGCQHSGEAVVVDPSRRVDQYVEAAKRQGLRIAHVTETHIHADFVSGARELAHETGARLYLSGLGGDDWSYRYGAAAGATLLHDGSRIRVGRVELSVIPTPGHTPEHLAFLVTDTATASEPMGAFTGDFLFVGDVGRPDLLERAANQKGTMESSARRLFSSLRRFRSLPDFLQIWPGHGAGSSCGKSLGAVPQSTLGYEKLTNWAFLVDDEDLFVRQVLEGQPAPPRYFAMMKRINRDGPPLVGRRSAPASLPPHRLAAAIAGGVVIDTRGVEAYGRGGVPGTINLPWNRAFTSWAGWLLPYDRDLYLIAEDGQAGEIVRELSGIGLDRVAGIFATDVVEERAGGAPLQRIPTITTERLESPGGAAIAVVDVRAAGEFRDGHVPGAINIPLGELPERLGDIPRSGLVVVHCQTGARAGIAASLILASGVSNVAVYRGGFAEWTAEGREVERSTL